MRKKLSADFSAKRKANANEKTEAKVSVSSAVTLSSSKRAAANEPDDSIEVEDVECQSTA